jgi:hypothetical protein
MTFEHIPDVPIHALFDEDLGPTDRDMMLDEADVIIGVDIMSQREFIVYGRALLRLIKESGEPRDVNLMKISLDQDTAELTQLLALVRIVKGSHDYEGD